MAAVGAGLRGEGLLEKIRRYSEPETPVYQQHPISQDGEAIASEWRARSPVLEIDGFRLAKHGEMPSPRKGKESHHGIISRWMREHYAGYDAKEAPSVLMTKEVHNITRGIYNTWRAEMRQTMGGQFHWSKVSEAEIRSLAERMFDDSNTPTAIREGYWRWFERMKTALTRE